MTALNLIRTNLRRYTFESPKIKKWVEERAKGKVLNLFSGRTKLDLNEVRNDKDKKMVADFNKDALDFVREWDGEKFDTIILDPPYSYRKSMEMYNGHKASRFNMIKDIIPKVLNKDGIVITFGYHSVSMGKKRGFKQEKILLMSHGGAIHDTIAVIESSENTSKEKLE